MAKLYHNGELLESGGGSVASPITDYFVKLTSPNTAENPILIDLPSTSATPYRLYILNWTGSILELARLYILYNNGVTRSHAIAFPGSSAQLLEGRSYMAPAPYSIAGNGINHGTRIFHYANFNTAEFLRCGDYFIRMDMTRDTVITFEFTTVNMQNSWDYILYLENPILQGGYSRGIFDFTISANSGATGSPIPHITNGFIYVGGDYDKSYIHNEHIVGDISLDDFKFYNPDPSDYVERSTADAYQHSPNILCLRFKFDSKPTTTVPSTFCRCTLRLDGPRHLGSRS